MSIVLLAGATASGKSAVAMCLAERLRGEIISADSMQVYRGMDIGTAKPSAAERARIPHHALDVVGPDESFDAARWLEAARAAAGDIRGRGRTPILCGGTGLYFRVWLQGLDAPGPFDAALRSELELRSLGELLAELREGDPEAAARIDASNPRRVVRAVEILRSRGRAPAQAAKPAPPGEGGVVWVLQREVVDLRQRIDQRVDAMFREGLVGETRALLGQGLNRTAQQAIGYRQVIEHLQGERDLAATVELVKVKTRQFARRQQTWFRHQVPALEVRVVAGEGPEAVAERCLRLRSDQKLSG